MAKVTGCTSVNPLPEMDSDEQLAEDFADYFLNKIVKISDDLDQYGKFVVESHEHVKELQAFYPLSETEIHKVINKLQTKSCELDHIPTYLMKNHLDYFIKPYIHIGNLSLVNGKSGDTWKCAISKASNKKAGCRYDENQLLSHQ